MYVLGGPLTLQQVKCVEDIDQWSLSFNDFNLFTFLTAEKIQGLNQNGHFYTGIEPRWRV